MPPARHYHPRTHAQHNPSHLRNIDSYTRADAPHSCAASKQICPLRHSKAVSYYIVNTRTYCDSLAHTSAPVHPDNSNSGPAMRVTAPESMESSSSLSTLLSEMSPPRPDAQKTSLHRARFRKCRRLPLKRNKNVGKVVWVSSWKPASSPPSSLLVLTSYVNVLPPTPETSQTPPAPFKAPRINILPPTPEVQHSVPLLGKIPTIKILPSTPNNALYVPSKQRTCLPHMLLKEPRRPRPAHNAGRHFQPEASCAAVEPNQTGVSHDTSPPLHSSDTMTSKSSPEKLMGTFKGPSYQPFDRPNYPAGYKPPMKKTASFIDLRDCWRCPEAELSERTLRRWSSGNQPDKQARKKRSSLAEQQDSTDEAPSAAEGLATADETTSLISTHMPPLWEALGIALDHSIEPEDVSDPQSHSCGIESFFSSIIFPFLAVYTFLLTVVATYFHDRDARSGQLGSHDTETARWLRRSEEYIDPQHSQRTYGPFSSAAREGPPVTCIRAGSFESVPTISHSRKGSREGVTSEQVKGSFGAMRWGSGIGEEYDPS